MKIALVGSTAYMMKMLNHREDLKKAGHRVRYPTMDYNAQSAWEILTQNRAIILWCEEVHVFWDQRFTGTIFDLGMAFALDKPIRLICIEEKTFLQAFKDWEWESQRVVEP